MDQTLAQQLLMGWHSAARGAELAHLTKLRFDQVFAKGLYPWT